MKPVAPKSERFGRLVTIGENQPEVLPLPARMDDERITTVWELDAVELGRLFAGGKIRLTITNFGRPMQPVFLDVVGDDL